MTVFLYNVFVYNYALGKTTLKFEKIKNLLRRDHEALQLYPFYDLMRMGLIDKVDDDSYGLTASQVFSDLKGEFSIGVNLPTIFFKKYNIQIYFQYLGLTVFKDVNWIDNPYNVDFNLDHYTHQFQSLKKIVREWKPIDVQYCKAFIKLLKLDPVKNVWRVEKVYSDINALYKRFIHSDLYFEYVFVYSNKYYSIKPYETEKILFIRLALIEQKSFSFDIKNQILSVKNGILLPNFIYKTLFIAHVLNKGELPTYNQFHLNRDQVNQIIKPLKLSYTLL